MIATSAAKVSPAATTVPFGFFRGCRRPSPSPLSAPAAKSCPRCGVPLRIVAILINLFTEWAWPAVVSKQH